MRWHKQAWQALGGGGFCGWHCAKNYPQPGAQATKAHALWGLLDIFGSAVHPIGHVRRLIEHARAGAWRWAFGGLMLLLTNASTMAVPELFRRAIDGLKQLYATGDVNDGEPWLRLGAYVGAPAATGQGLRQIALAVVGVALCGALFRTLSRVHILYAARDVELSLRASMYRHLTRMDPRFYLTYPTGDLMSRATNDLTQVRLMLGPGALNLVNTVVAYATAVPLMMQISTPLTLLAFIIYPPALFLLRRLGKQLYHRNRAQQQALGTLSNTVQENLAAATLVRAYAMDKEQTQAFDAVNSAYFRTSLRLAFLRSGMFRLAGSIAGVGILAVTFIGASDVMNKALSLGDVVALVEYMALLSGPTFAMGWVLSLWQRGAASLGRLAEILDVVPELVNLGLEDQEGRTVQAPIFARTLKVEGLKVRLGEKVALQNINFIMKRGATLGIVGPIGSGKTTLARALLRLVALEAGQIFVDDQRVGQDDAIALRTLFSYVPQNPMLLSKSVAQNVAFGRPDATEDEIRDALRQAAFAEDLNTLPHGLDTQVGEKGVTLSGGQKQRCALARALLVNRPILILDDALSAVDVSTEAHILRALKARASHQSTLIIAHRTSSVQHADEILVLDEGRIIEQGSHHALAHNRGIYADMVQRQAVGAA